MKIDSRLTNSIEKGMVEIELDRVIRRVAEALDDLIDCYDPNDRIRELIEEIPALKKYMKENL